MGQLIEQPQYMGVWKNAEKSEEEIFFLEIVLSGKRGRVSGRILDSIGQSRFEGVMCGSDLDIVKRYADVNSRVAKPEDFKTPIYYKGSVVPIAAVVRPVYVGDYSVGKNGAKGRFEMSGFRNDCVTRALIRKMEKELMEKGVPVLR